MNKARHMAKAIVAMAGMSPRAKAINHWEDQITLGGPRIRPRMKPRGVHPEDHVNDWRRFTSPGIPQNWKPNNG